MNKISLINPNDTIERQNEKLLQIAQSLMRRVEQKNEQSGLAYQQFERAALLESEVRERTQDLERALDLLQESNARLEIANDETERVRSNLTQAIETINEGFALFEADEGLVLSNSRFCRDLIDIEGRLTPGLSFDAYVKLVSESSYLALPDDTSPALWAQQRLTKHREDHVVFNSRLKWDRWLQVSEHRTPRGGTVILQTDVTAIIRRERLERDKMRDAQAEILQATLDHLNQGVCIFDANQTLVGRNSKLDELFSLKPNQVVLGMNFTPLLEYLKDELVFEDNFDAAFIRDWANRPKHRAPIVFEVNHRRSQNLSVFCQEMPDQGFVISFTDVTAERSAARTLLEMNELLEQRVQTRTHELGLALAEAERANASKSRFVAAASHDLLQPLSAAKLFVSSLGEQIDTSEARSISEKAETALESVEQFISALLDISKLDAGKAVFDVQPVHLSQIFRPLRDELAPLAAQKGIDLRMVDSTMTIVSDPGYMRRIVQNLLSNAIRYTDKGRVLLGVRRVNGKACIEVWDTGRGIAKGDQETIFKEFERIAPDNSDTGLGLGLSVVERACKELGHKLKLVSETNKGSCFSITVPVYHEFPSRRTKAEQSATNQERPLSDKLFMLVACDDQIQKTITTAVEQQGATIIQAYTATEAISILGEIQLVPDSLLIDINLEQTGEGLSLYQDICAKFGQVSTTIFSTQISPEAISSCEQLGATLIAYPDQLGDITRQL